MVASAATSAGKSVVALVFAFISVVRAAAIVRIYAGAPNPLRTARPEAMAAKGQMTGMLGVYLTAAELTDKGLIVSITSRNAKGADLLATDQFYKRTWAIQVKTNRKAAKFWLLNKSYGVDVSPTHVYIFVNLRGKERPEYYIVPSKIVARDGFTSTSGTGSIWYAYDVRKAKAERYRENWGIFGNVLPQSA